MTIFEIYINFSDTNKAYPIFEFPLPILEYCIRTIIQIYYYKVMPFNLKNASATYQLSLTQIFSKLIHNQFESYIFNLMVKRKEKKTPSIWLESSLWVTMSMQHKDKSPKVHFWCNIKKILMVCHSTLGDQNESK